MRGLATGAAFALFVVWSGMAGAQTAEEVLAQFEEEPSILEVQEMATAYAHIDQEVVSDWTTRANLAALLPELRVQYWVTAEDDEQTDEDRGYEVNDQGDPIWTDYDYDLRIENDDEVRVRIQGDWELADLVFNPDLLRISNETSDLVELREDILTTVTSLYFERRRAQVQMVVDAPVDAVERLRRELEIQELTAGIDALTGGWFSQELSVRGLPTY